MSRKKFYEPENVTFSDLGIPMPSLTPENYRIVLNRLIDHDAEKVSRLCYKHKVADIDGVENVPSFGRSFRFHSCF